MLKYLNQLRITSTWQKAAASGGWKWLHLKKSDTWDLPMIEIIEMVEKNSTMITKQYGTYFCILEYFIQSL